MDQSELNAIFANYETYDGLTSSQAEARLKIYGENARVAIKHRSWLKRLLNIASEPMILLLLAATAVYFFLGEKIETFILLGSIVPIVLIEFIQEQRTDQAVRALDKLMVQYSMVFRDQKIVKLESKFLVPGDLVYLTAGDQVSADGIALRSPGLAIDESLLTGESAPVIKSMAPNPPTKITDAHKLSQGTLVLSGEGYLLVTATGANTAYGQLGGLLEKITTGATPLQNKIRRLVRGLALGAGAVALTVGLIMGIRNGLAVGFLSGITMAMSLIPEEIPVVFSVFLIMGVWRLAKQKALTREMAMVETLGSATVICTDKTGTLTEGNMALQEIYYHEKSSKRAQLIAQREHYLPFFEIALLSLEQVAIDPLEIETQRFARELGIDTDALFKNHTLIADSPFSAKTKTVHHIWRSHKNILIQYTAGAPEIVISTCQMTNAERAQALKHYENMAEQGRRVIAIALQKNPKNNQISTENLEFVGLIAMSDPPRPGVKDAIEMCQKAGIRIIMITGDNKLTAHSIAESVGLKHNEEIINGDDLENLSPTALINIARRHDIFARVRPEQKYNLVCALQESGEIVAMTGDGVNDAPALKKANIGVAMGRRGTEVARAAAGIVLLDDNFATIANAVREGRRIYDNLRQAFSFLFVFHLPIVIMAIAPLFFGKNLIFYPVHIIFLELICDPAAVLGFERETARRGLMNHPPRPTKEPIIKTELIKQIFIQGVLISAVTLGLYWLGEKNGGETVGRTLAFGSLVVSQIALIIFSREWHQVRQNKFLLMIAAITLLSLVLIVLIPFLRAVFHFSILSPTLWLLMFAGPTVIMSAIGTYFKRDGI